MEESSELIGGCDISEIIVDVLKGEYVVLVQRKGWTGYPVTIKLYLGQTDKD